MVSTVLINDTSLSRQRKSGIASVSLAYNQRLEEGFAIMKFHGAASVRLRLLEM